MHFCNYLRYIVVADAEIDALVEGETLESLSNYAFLSEVKWEKAQITAGKSLGLASFFGRFL